MGGMRRTGPFVAIASFFVSVGFWTLRLGLDPEPLARSSGLVIAGGITGYGLIAVVGLLLVRGRWAKFLALSVTGSTFVVAGILDFDAALGAGLVLSGAAIVALTGPWLVGWVRMLPSATGPPPRAVIVALLPLALVPGVGAACPSGLDPAHWVMATAGVATSWAYARGVSWGVWAVRGGLLAAAIPAIVAAPPGGKLVLGSLVMTVTALGWNREVRLASHPIMERLPRPRSVRTPAPGAPSEAP